MRSLALHWQNLILRWAYSQNKCQNIPMNKIHGTVTSVNKDIPSSKYSNGTKFFIPLTCSVIGIWTKLNSDPFLDLPKWFAQKDSDFYELQAIHFETYLTFIDLFLLVQQEQKWFPVIYLGSLWRFQCIHNNKLIHCRK